MLPRIQNNRISQIIVCYIELETTVVLVLTSVYHRFSNFSGRPTLLRSNCYSILLLLLHLLNQPWETLSRTTKRVERSSSKNWRTPERPECCRSANTNWKPVRNKSSSKLCCVLSFRFDSGRISHPFHALYCRSNGTFSIDSLHSLVCVCVRVRVPATLAVLSRHVLLFSVSFYIQEFPSLRRSICPRTN
jgi:hypothetical protein